MDDREAGTYSTPEDASRSYSEARAGQKRLGTGLPTLFGSVFVAFVLVALIVLTVRYLV